MGHGELYGAGSFVLGLPGCNWVVCVSAMRKRMFRVHCVFVGKSIGFVSRR